MPAPAELSALREARKPGGRSSRPNGVITSQNLK
jgi:hypothetical protein